MSGSGSGCGSGGSADKTIHSAASHSLMLNKIDNSNVVTFADVSSVRNRN